MLHLVLWKCTAGSPIPFSYIFRLTGTLPGASQGLLLSFPHQSLAPVETHTEMTGLCPHHIPDKIGEPVDDRLHPADELQVLCFANPLLDQEHNKTGWDKGHGKDDANGHKDVY